MKKTRTITIPAKAAETHQEEYRVCDVCGKFEAYKRCAICDRDVCSSWNCRATDPEDHSDYPATWCRVCCQLWTSEYGDKTRAIEEQAAEAAATLLEQMRVRSLETGGQPIDSATLTG